MDLLHPVQVAYSLVFGATAVVCFAAVSRALDRVEDSDTRIGLVSLLVTTGLWTSFYVGRILSPSPDVQLTFYVLGLTTGLASIGAWLYFCSAYAGKPYHRNPVFRRAAVLAFAIILAIKLTTPTHGLYFSTTPATTPFPHLTIRWFGRMDDRTDRHYRTRTRAPAGPSPGVAARQLRGRNHARTPEHDQRRPG